jgi:hypothetical protein
MFKGPHFDQMAILPCIRWYLDEDSAHPQSQGRLGLAGS